MAQKSRDKVEAGVETRHYRLPMRIVHLSTSDVEGGAARAAWRLHQALRRAGEDSLMVVRRKTLGAPTVHAAPGKQDDACLWGYIVQNRCLDRNRTPLSNTWFSLGWPGQDLSQDPLVREADLLNLHWVSDFQSPASLARLQGLGKPLVWTLHDQRAFTGGCHFSAGCDGYRRDCAACPQLASDPCGLPGANLQVQRALWSPGAFTLVCPSRWMAGCARQSALFSTARIEVISNGIEPEVFRDLPPEEARAALGLPGEGLNLLFGSDYGGERRKGWSELAAALEVCARAPVGRRLLQEGRLRLICFGRPDERLDQLPIPVRSFGLVNSDETLNRLYAAADLFLMPSTEDNLPNTVLEAMSSGTPVAAFKVGGVPDMVVEGETGGMAATVDPEELARVILSLLGEPARLQQMRPRCRARVLENFTAERQAGRYRALYRELLDRPPQAGGAASPVPTSASAPGSLDPLLRCLLCQAFASGDDVLPPTESLAPREAARRERFHEFMRGAFLDPSHSLEDQLEAASGLLRGRPVWRSRLRQSLRRRFQGASGPRETSSPFRG